jgi:exonuclease III
MLHRFLNVIYKFMWVFCRVDYQIATPATSAKAVSTSVYKAARFSDHAPLIIEHSD